MLKKKKLDTSRSPTHAHIFGALCTVNTGIYPRTLNIRDSGDNFVLKESLQNRNVLASDATNTKCQ